MVLGSTQSNFNISATYFEYRTGCGPGAAGEASGDADWLESRFAAELSQLVLCRASPWPRSSGRALHGHMLPAGGVGTWANRHAKGAYGPWYRSTGVGGHGRQGEHAGNEADRVHPEGGGGEADSAG